MPQFHVEISGPDAASDARQLQNALAQTAHARVAPSPTRKGVDPVMVVTVSAAVLQSVSTISLQSGNLYYDIFSLLDCYKN